MDEKNVLAAEFERQRGRLRAVAYRMLGSLAEADDAVQETWLRLSRSDADAVDNLGGWLTTVVGRVCLDVLRARKSHREEPLGPTVPDPIVTADGASEAELADSVGLALLVVLETLAPAERLAFVLHDMFGLPFEEIAPIVGRTPTTARQLASRGRRRVQGAATPDADRARQRAVVDAFFAASRGGDYDALVAVLAPDVVLRAAVAGGETRELRGAGKVAKGSILFSKQPMPTRVDRAALVNGAPGNVTFVDGKPFSILGFTVVGDRIVEIDIVSDPARLARIDLSAL